MRGRGDLVESNKGVADRLTAAVQQAYAPVIEKAKQGDLQARRASEMARTAETLASDKKRLEEALQGQQKRFEVLTELQQVDPLAVQQLMREAKERLTVAKVRKEFVRRVNELPKLARSAAGLSSRWPSAATPRWMRSAAGSIRWIGSESRRKRSRNRPSSTGRSRQRSTWP